MGVQGLWPLLAPSGRRINIESLSLKTLAVDVSIWLVQFIKAMRDDEGKMIRHAHLIGTMRRLAKLMFHRIRPVFVFDGGVPILKRLTVQKRQERRREQEATFRQQAQSILVAQLKKQIEEKRLVELGTSEKQDDASNYAPGFNPGNQTASEDNARKTVAAVQESSSAAAYSTSPTAEVVVSSSEDEIEWEDGDARADEPGDWDVGAAAGGGEAIDESSLRAMPVSMRKGIIEAVHRDYRKTSRDSYLKVAGDMDGYSCTQIASFLKVSKFNQKVWNTAGNGAGARSGAAPESEGRSIASEPGRRFFLGTGLEYAQQKKGGSQHAEQASRKRGSVAAMESWLEAQKYDRAQSDLSMLDHGRDAITSKMDHRATADSEEHENSVSSTERLQQYARESACVDSGDEDPIFFMSEPGETPNSSESREQKKDGKSTDGGFIVHDDSETPSGVKADHFSEQTQLLRESGISMSTDMAADSKFQKPSVVLDREVVGEVEDGGFILDGDSDGDEKNPAVASAENTGGDNAGAEPGGPDELSLLSRLGKLQSWAEEQELQTALQRSLEPPASGTHATAATAQQAELSASLGTWGLVEEPVSRDNNCLFHALALQLGRLGRFFGEARALREVVVSWMRANGSLVLDDGDSAVGTLRGARATLSQFVEGDWGRYLDRMGRHGGSWGDHAVLVSAGTYRSSVSYVILMQYSDLLGF